MTGPETGDGLTGDGPVVPREAEVPPIDAPVAGVVERIHLLSRYLDTLRGQVTAPHQLSARDYDILARLFRAGPPHRLTPTQLAANTHAPATTVTSRLDRLERRGLLRRLADPRDRRSLLAELTDEGANLFGSIVTEQARRERELIGGLPGDDLERLGELLAGLMRRCESQLGRTPPRP